MEQAPDAVTDHALYEPLTNRELEILQLLAQGLSNREIADKLVLALTTVKWYVRQIFEKLDVTRRREALAVAQRLGLLVDSLEVPSGALTQALPVGRNPYKGLRPFHQRDAHDFFGRDALTQRLLSRLGERGEDSRFLAVVGPSGSGKSSVVRAGLIPALQHGAMAGAENWVMADLVPGSHPFDELELALRRVAVERPGDLMEQLQRDESGLLRASRLILPDDGQLLLLIDQFEELFSLVNDPRVARRFLDLLYAASIDPHSSMRVLITLRADFYDRPLMIPDFSTLVRSRTEVVIPLTPAELEQAIVHPAQAAGVGVEPALVAALIAAVNDQPGTLPLLQYALTELFERREGRVMTLRAYERLGGVLGALTRQADEVYDDLDEPDQALAKQIFLRLVTLGEGTEDLRRRVLRSELTALAPDANRMSRLVDAFGASGLLTFDRDVRTQGPTVEVAHEALLREWWRLREWLEDSRADIRQQRVLSAAALEWERARHEKSYLLSGVRLAQFNGWAETALVALTPDEQQFLSVSVAMERQQNLIRRRRRNLALATAVVVALIMTVLAVITFDREQVAQRERDYARELALVNGAQAMLERDDIETALALALVANTTGSIPGQAQEILSRAAYRPGPMQWFRGHSAAVLDSVYSPDGSRMISIDFAGSIMLWDVRTGQSLPLQGHNSGFAQNVDWSADGRSVLTASTDLSIIIWDAQTGEMIRRLSSAELTNDSGLATVFARFAPDGKHILSTNGSGPGVDGRPSKLLWWDVESGTVTRVLEGHSSTACGIGISPDGTKALSGAGRGELILWDLETGQVLQRFGDVTDDPQLALAHFVEYVEFSPDGRTALTRAFDGKTTLLWDMETFALLHRLEIPDSTWSGAGRSTFSADGRWIAASGSSTVIWDAVTGAFVTTVNRDSTSVDFGPDSGSLLIGSGEIVLWDIYNGAELKRYPIPPEIWFYDLSADGARLVYAIGSNQGEVDSICEIVAVDVESGEQVSRFQHGTISGDGLHNCFVLNLLVSPDGRTVLIARVDGLIELWDLSSGEHLRTFNAATTRVYNLAFSPDGRTIAGAASEVMLWDVATGQEIRRFVGLESEISALRFSPDGRGLLACTSEGEIVLWDVLTGQEQRRYEHAQGNITDVTTFGTSAAFSHDGRMIMIGSSVGTFIWETASGQLLYRLPRSEYAAFAADDRSVFSSSWADAEQAVVQHDLASGEIIRRYPLPSEEAIILHPDGKSFFTKDLSGAIYRWRIDSHAALIAWTLSHRAVRELTCEERVTYRLEPLCGVEGIAATRTPFLTPVPTGVVVQPSATVPPTTPTPTVPPRDVRTAQVSENRGTVSMGDYQSWQYAGRAGEVLTLRVEADKPWSVCSESERQSAESGCLDTLLIATHPDGIHMNFVFQNGAILSPASSDDIDAENSDSLIEGLLLPVDGMYTLTVSGVASQSGGAYRLLIESTPAG